jgi:hypothetical protein
MFPTSPNNSIHHGTASTLESASEGLASGTSAAISLNSKGPVGKIPELTEGNQTKFIDSADRVCQGGPHSVRRR